MMRCGVIEWRFGTFFMNSNTNLAVDAPHLVKGCGIQCWNAGN